MMTSECIPHQVLVPEIRLSVNLNASTIEQVRRWPQMAPDSAYWRPDGS